MDEEELEQIRNRRAQERYAQLAKAQQLEAEMKTVLRHVLDDVAYERAMNVRLANPELYQQLVALLAYMYQNKQLRGKVSDAQLKMLLTKVASTRREPTISIKKK